MREAVLECGFDVRKWFSRLVGTNILMDFATAAPIEMATLLWLGLTALCVMFDRWPLLRGRKRRFEPFAFLTLLALAEELYLRIWHKQYFTSLPWKGAVAYGEFHRPLVDCGNFARLLTDYSVVESLPLRITFNFGTWCYGWKSGGRSSCTKIR